MSYCTSEETIAFRAWSRDLAAWDLEFETLKAIYESECDAIDQADHCYYRSRWATRHPAHAIPWARYLAARNELETRYP